MTLLYTTLYIGLALFCAALGAVLLLWFRIRHQRRNPIVDTSELGKQTMGQLVAKMEANDDGS